MVTLGYDTISSSLVASLTDYSALYLDRFQSSGSRMVKHGLGITGIGIIDLLPFEGFTNATY